MTASRRQRADNDRARIESYEDTRTMRIAVTGASGLIGTRLAELLAAGGHTVVRVVRREPDGDSPDAFWDPAAGHIDAAKLEGLDAVVHLAGENVGAGRWTEERKKAILRSRADGTALLSTTLSKLEKPPRVLVSASAVGFYGDRGAEYLTENSEAGSGFLAEVCKAWEDTSLPAIEAGVRVVNTRFGVVLSGAGGALPRMVTPFRFGLGGVIGSGQQYVSWISLDDAVGVIYHCMLTEALSGPVNATAPTPVTNRELTRTLGRVLRRPTLIPLPAFVVDLVLGEMGRALLLDSARVIPEHLVATRFRFLHPLLDTALRAELGR
jgi:uncharacterized protein (TIGR01777 family)